MYRPVKTRVDDWQSHNFEFFVMSVPNGENQW